MSKVVKYPSYGEWHTLTVSRTEIFPIPFDAEHIHDYDEAPWYELQHPEGCGAPCPFCSSVPHCGIEWEIHNVGVDAYGELAYGQYKVRHWADKSVIHGIGTEYDTGIEVLTMTDWKKEYGSNN